MKLQDFQVSKCSPHVHIPFAVSWSQDNVISMATDMGVYLMVSIYLVFLFYLNLWFFTYYKDT